MFEGVNYIELSGEKLPIKCDMVVLEKIQEEYEDLDAFEEKLNGFTPNRNANGEIEMNKEGMAIGIFRTPNIKTVNQTLVWMVQEGLEIEAEKKKEPLKEIDKKDLLRKVDITPRELGKALHKEFLRCFARKNAVTTQREKTEVPSK